MASNVRLLKVAEAGLAILLLVVGVTLAVFLVSSSGTEVYTAESQLVVKAGLGLEATGDVLTAPRLAATYGSLARTRPMLEAVITTLSLTDDPRSLDARLRITTDPSSPFITIAATDERPAIAKQIANLLADMLVERATSPIVATDPGQAILEIVQRAATPEEPSGPRTLFNSVLAAAATFVVAAAAVATIAYARSGRRPEEPGGR